MNILARLLHIILAAAIIATAQTGVASYAAAAPTAQTRQNNNRKSKPAAKKQNPAQTATRQKGKKNSRKTSAPNNPAKQTNQNRSQQQVRREKKQTEAELRETQRQMQLNTRLTEQHLNRLDLVEGEIGQCNTRIGNISQRIDSINSRINVVTDSISTLDSRLASISKNYAKALRKTQGRGQQTSMMAFIFSSDSFAEAYRRMNSVRQFDKWRKNKETEISQVRESLDSRRLSLTSLQQKHETSRRELGNERNLLQQKQKLTAQLVDSLKNRGAELDAIIGQRSRQAAQLDAELDNIIAREAEEKARQKAQAEAKAKAEAEARARAQAEEAEKARIAREEAERLQRERETASLTAQATQASAPASTKSAPSTKTDSDVPPPPARKKTDKKNDVPAPKQNAKGVKRDKRNGKDAGKAQVPPPPQRQEKQTATVPAPKTTPSAEGGNTAPRLSTPSGNYASGTASTHHDTPAPGADFAQMQGSLMFPVAGHYTIVKRFGRQKHPKLPHIETTNSGLDLQTQPRASVRAVFDGEVSAIFRPDGFNNVVVLRHGDYLTVYANLGQISVSTHQKVKAGQTIGTVYADPDDDGRSVLHFEVRHGRDKQDPELWLRP